MHTTTAPTPWPVLEDIAPDLLTAEEEFELSRRIEAGVAAEAALHGWLGAPPDVGLADLHLLIQDGERARVDLVRANTGLVWWVVLPIARSTGYDREELVQEGMVGLLEAIQRFDVRRGRLVTYAVPRIKMRVWDAAVTSGGRLGLPARRARRWRQARQVSAELTVALARTPRAEEVADALEESIGVVRSLLTWVPPVSLAPDASSWDEVVCDGPQIGASVRVDRLAVRRLLRRLDPFDRALVTQLFGLEGQPCSHAEVARALGRSESTIRRRERQALELLRAGTTSGLAA